MIKESRILLGLMRINTLSDDELSDLLITAYENGINFLDVAEIYSDGYCEEKLGTFFTNNPEYKDKFLVQTKAGIVHSQDKTFNYYDFSYNYLNDALNKSLKRMKLEKIHSFLLHRPDVTFDSKEIEKFVKNNSSKVDNFGISNVDGDFVECMPFKVKYNQMQMSLTETQLIDSILNCNTMFNGGIYRSGNSFLHSIKNNYKLQIWSPFQYGFFEGVFIDNPKFEKLNSVLQSLSDKYHCTKNTIAISWLLTLHNNIQVVIGTKNKNRLIECAKALNLTLTKEEFYRIYLAVESHKLP